jgi:hypothetical protein
MHHIIAAAVAGSVVGGATTARGRLRPVLRSAIKGGIVAKRKIQAYGAAALAETHKLVDEARAELNATKPEQPS